MGFALTIFLLTLSLYTHLGVPAMIILGLFIYSARHKGYYPFFKSIFMWSFVFYLPWFLRVLPELGWLGMPSTAIAEQGGRTMASCLAGVIMGFLSLQFLSPVVLGLGLWGLKRFRHPAAVSSWCDDPCVSLTPIQIEIFNFDLSLCHPINAVPPQNVSPSLTV